MTAEQGDSLKPLLCDQFVLVTVFTPTYNRRHTIDRLYRSLQAQTFKDFEWLIVDDGSTDDTASLVAKWQQKDNAFPIRYYWKENGGKHTAHNYALTRAQGEYFAIQDSDDWYTNDALEILVAQWDSIPYEIRGQYSNVEGKCKYKDGKIIGNLFPKDLFDGSNFEVQRLHEKPGDTMGMFRLEILKEFPFPENFDGYFVPESLVWERIADKYKTRFINTVIGNKEYMADGLTKRPLIERFKKSEPTILYYRERAQRKGVGSLQRIKCKINVYRYSFHNSLAISTEFMHEKSMLPNIPFIFFGFLLYIKDQIVIHLNK